MARKPVNGRLFEPAPASTCRVGCTAVAGVGALEVSSPATPPAGDFELSSRRTSPRLSPLSYAATEALFVPVTPSIAGPAPAVLSNMPVTSIDRMARRDFMRLALLARLPA